MAVTPKGNALPKDGGGNELQTPTRTITNWNQKSPITVSSVELFIDIPTNAVSILVQADGADLRVSMKEGGTAAAGTYFVVQDGGAIPFYVIGWNRLYLLRNASTDVTCSFLIHLSGFLAE